MAKADRCGNGCEPVAPVQRGELPAAGQGARAVRRPLRPAAQKRQSQAGAAGALADAQEIVLSDKISVYFATTRS
jgi:hypothetical protein